MKGFDCPHCGGHNLSVKYLGCTIEREVVAVNELGRITENPSPIEIKQGYARIFYCTDCREWLRGENGKTVTTNREILLWLARAEIARMRSTNEPVPDSDIRAVLV